MTNLVAALYSTLTYLFFLATFLYAIGFVQNLAVPKSIDSGSSGDLIGSLLINAALLTVFALQHSVMARPRFKRAWTRVVPQPVERSTYVLFASLALALLFWQWRPLPQTVWFIDDPASAALVPGMSWAGWSLVLLSTFLISHFHLFGLSQGFARLLRRHQPDLEFATPSLYRWLRHPIYAGFILAFWAAPHMTAGHLLFAVATTGYILVGIWLEERDLVAHFGDRYRLYRESVGMLLPKIRVSRYPHKARVTEP
ncbi:MAG TPA: NnrU family protein [Steroidobacteraceae bacterium]|nr:NnrU family protein [Steroidobacteraceae bacterium]